MDVFNKNAVLISALSFLLVACNEPSSGERKFSNTIDNEYCQSYAVENQYVIKYKDGRLKVVTARDKDELFKDYVEPDFDEIEVVDRDIRFVTPSFNSLEAKSMIGGSNTWGQENINADAAWDAGFYGQGITVAVIDSGVNVEHESLKYNIAENPGENGFDENGMDRATNGIDDDNNGLVDDARGYNFAANKPGNNEGDEAHGTHVAGIIASLHDPFIGGQVYGVAPKAKILPIDFIDGNGGSIESAINSIDYVIKMKDIMNVKVVNASWGGAICSTILENKISELKDHGILFVAAAGNNQVGQNIDYYQEFPAAYKMENIITVGAITWNSESSGWGNGMASWSNYGDESVDIMAPGEDIYSTVLYDNASFKDGTSMAAPFVAGAAAVLWSKHPSATYQQIKEALLLSGDYNPTYRCSSESRLNLASALNYLDLL